MNGSGDQMDRAHWHGLPGEKSIECAICHKLVGDDGEHCDECDMWFCSTGCFQEHMGWYHADSKIVDESLQAGNERGRQTGLLA